MALFRLVHLSDMHFSGHLSDYLNPIDGCNFDAALSALEILNNGPLSNLLQPSTFNEEVAGALANYIALHEDEYDLMVVTGDLATTGSCEDLELARDFFSGKVSHRIHPASDLPFFSLIGGEMYSLFLPGNHDRYEGRRLLPNGKHFERYFGMNWDCGIGHVKSLDNGRSERVKFFQLEKEFCRLAILMADFSLASWDQGNGIFGYVGQGSVSQDILNDLSSKTLDLQGDAINDGVRIAVLWAIHFPPQFPGIKSDLKLIRDDVLVREAAHRKVSGILAGHTHESHFYSIGEGGVSIVCCGASAGLSANASYSFNEIEIQMDFTSGVVKIQPSKFLWDTVKRDFKRS